ncbi:SNF2 family DNA or RNA helicase [Clostridium tetanomorphum]|uniref:DEAD/DEAH box helicase n=1 Tax=Clostridium tetanomorphum TaxID=1553 RepID=A0A923J1X0_CLOTT|nr:DEAD/DEAH box helicase [Clostridium tetanomorphum]KAJ50710.1 SNF2-related protein [Clostridium tetanomorphum DSM 665]MBC2399671.1 DEAD/DEAH box helicase [Clostridium tetanomorphum]MBP1862784.1 SNF2 family DNA or RNA helicase [Clostridium tetanomorphum]NRS85377.1 SNF2 family DNA or RNA helicase [Clostridium tetanomorphum]NRZ98554.1 SNF2 family DNA or RNA helicase [Clostridium tetanomorphum]
MKLKKVDYKPHGYQAFSTEFILKHKSAGLFLECGLGKSVITLTAIVELMYNMFDVSKVLVIAPLRVADTTWQDEIEKWEHLKYLKLSKVLGSKKNRIMALYKKADVYTINRENVPWLVDFYKNDWPFDMVIIDELSSFKSPSAKRFKALKKVRHKIKRIVGLTGTPAPNGLLNIWSQIYLLDGGERLGRTFTGYRNRYFHPQKYINGVIPADYVINEDAEENIYEKISDICISMKALDYLKMPECIFNKVMVELSEKDMKLYHKLERDLLLPFEDSDVDAKNAAVLSNKLLQMASGAVYDEFGDVKLIHDKKLDALEDLIEAANGKSVLVYYGFKHDKDRIKERFEVEEINTSDDIAKWNEGKIQIAICHPASTGHGLNLQEGGCTIIWFSMTWSLELYQQANARLYRQGQKHTVVIHHIIAKDTVDEKVIQALENKDTSQTALIDAVKARIKKQEGRA